MPPLPQKKDDWDKVFRGTNFNLKLAILTGDSETPLEVTSNS